MTDHRCGRGLCGLRTFDDAQLAEAELGSAPREIVLGPGSDDFPATDGLLLDDPSAETQEAVLAAVREWVDDFDAAVADRLMAVIEAELADTAVS